MHDVHACHMHAKLDSLKLRLFVVWQTILVLCGDTSASQMKARSLSSLAIFVHQEILLVHISWKLRNLQHTV